MSRTTSPRAPARARPPIRLARTSPYSPRAGASRVTAIGVVVGTLLAMTTARTVTTSHLARRVSRAGPAATPGTLGAGSSRAVTRPGERDCSLHQVDDVEHRQV